MISRYFKQFKDCEVIDKESFLSWLGEIKDGSISPADLELIERLLADFDRPLTEQAEQFLTERITDTDAAYRTAEALEKFHNGDEIEFGDVLRGIVDRHSRVRGDANEDAPISDSIADIMARSNDTFGFRWPFACMNKAMRPAQPGDMILVAARPDVGKTSLICRFVSCFNNQLEKVFPGEGRCILHLNNEGPGSRVKLRFYQTVLGWTLHEMSAAVEAGTLDDAFSAAIPDNRLQVYDIHGWNTARVERLIEKVNPGVIIFDMADHVKYTSEDMSRNSRTDEYLEGLYKWAREIGVKYESVMLMSTQLNGEAENMQYPSLGMLKDSKTGKQGTADAIITLGYVSTNPNTRYLGLTKNKLRLGSSNNRLGEVSFDGARGLFTEPTPEGGPDET